MWLQLVKRDTIFVESMNFVSLILDYYQHLGGDKEEKGARGTLQGVLPPLTPILSSLSLLSFCSSLPHALPPLSFLPFLLSLVALTALVLTRSLYRLLSDTLLLVCLVREGVNKRTRHSCLSDAPVLEGVHATLLS